MHMADALLSPEVGATMWAVSACATAVGCKKITNTDVSEKKLPIMAVSGAFVFAAQMINFAIPGTGSSGHIGGGILLAMLLGEFPALITIASVLVIQCLFFADGGLLALGANIFNMGVVPCLIVYPVVRIVLKKKITRIRLSVCGVIASVVGLQIGAFCVVLETLASGITQLPFLTFVSLMQPIHLAIGLGEGIITMVVVVFIWQMRPELIVTTVEKTQLESKTSVKKIVVILAIISVVVAGGLSMHASSNPDGLEWSIEKTANTTEIDANGTVYDNASYIQRLLSVFPDYDFQSGSGNGTSLAGLIGAGMTCLLALGCGGAIKFIKKKNQG